jgi:hypothetical protein
MRLNKRPLNMCKSCSYTWYPRGKSLSGKCPRCGSTATDLVFLVVLLAVLWLLAWPFVQSYRLICILKPYVIPFVILASSRIWSSIVFCSYWLTLPFSISMQWLLSIKDDFTENENVSMNPWSFAAKVFVLTSLCVALVILGIVLRGHIVAVQTR